MQNITELTKIYALKCPFDNIIKYVGKTVMPLNKRLLGHVSTALRKKHLKGKHEWFRRVRESDLQIEIILLEECENWIEREIYWIDYYSQQGELYNKTRGGEDFVFKTHHNPWNKGGGVYTPEMIEKMRVSHLGKKDSEETKKRKSEAAIGKPKSPNVGLAAKERCSKSTLQYTLQGEFLKEYTSVSSASIQTEINSSDVSMCCTGRIKTAGGFQWRYKDGEIIQNIGPSKPITSNQIVQMTLEGEVIRIWDSAIQCAEGTGYYPINIREKAKKEQVYHGFKWKLIQNRNKWQ